MEASAQSGVSRREERIPFDAVVELCADDGSEPLEADGVNLSIGGMALRARFLPRLGSLLDCRFACPPEGDLISARGEVTWIADRGPELGSFGVRFVELDTKSATTLRRWLRQSEPPPDRLRSASLHIDGLGAAVDTELKLADETRIVLEQQLPFLQLGRGVEVQLLGRGKERGRIGSIELRHTDFDVPTLVFGILLDAAPEPDAVPVGSSSGPVFGDPLEADDLDDEHDSSDAHAELADEQAAAHAAVPRNVRVREPVRGSARDSRAPEARSSALAMGAWLSNLRTALRAALSRIRARLVPALREQAVALDLPDAKTRLLLQVARMRALVLLLRRKRVSRTTKPPPLRVQRTSVATGGIGGESVRERRLRWVAVGLFVVGGALITYALAMRAPELAPPAPVPVVAPTPLEDEPSEAAFAPEQPALSPESAVTPTFGDAEVPNGRVFVLRMDGPVRTIEGEARENGLKIRIPRRRSRDRASPIAESHPAVARAMILNRSKYSELTVDFLPGLRPRYQVVGKGDTLEVTLERLDPGPTAPAEDQAAQ